MRNVLKRHRVVAWVLAFALTLSTAAFAAWVTGSVTKAQNGKGRIVSQGALARVVTVLPTDGEATTQCTAPGATTVANCPLYLKVNNSSGTPITLTKLSFDRTVTANVVGSVGACPGTLTSADDLGPGTNFVVAGVRSTNIIDNVVSIGPIPVGAGTVIAVPNAWGINATGDQSGCAGGSVSFINAGFTATFAAA